MARYYFHLRDGTDTLFDREGRELAGAAAIEEAALREARSIISGDAREGHILLAQRIDVEDEGHAVVHSLEFRDAVEIVGERLAPVPRPEGG